MTRIYQPESLVLLSPVTKSTILLTQNRRPQP
jgi:hypothetical protein